MLVGCFLLPPSVPPDRLTKAAGSVRRRNCARTLPTVSNRLLQRNHETDRRLKQSEVGSHAEEIQDTAVFRRPVGAGDSLLLLLGDSVESKGTFSILDCFPLQNKVCLGARVDLFPQNKAAVKRCASVPTSLSLGVLLFATIDALRNVTKGLQISVGRH